MHQVKVKIVDAAGLQLALKERTNVFFFFEKGHGQLVGQNIAAARMAAGKTGFDRLFAFALQIAVRGVKIVETGVQKGVDHLTGLLDINRAVFHRQAHKAKAEVLFDLLHGAKLLSSVINILILQENGENANYRLFRIAARRSRS